jgi:gamma-glutamylcyclotransferase (GGCT)/AIG2-like uncharacterized protein YtfP
MKRNSKYTNASKILKLNSKPMGKSKEIFMEQREQEEPTQIDWQEQLMIEHFEVINKDFHKNKCIFVYGTLQKDQWNHGLIQDCKFISKATTKDKYLLTASSIPFVNKSEAVSTVKGEVYELPDTQRLSKVDGLESHPIWYKREVITVLDSNGNELEAWIYFNQQDRGYEVIKDGDYINYISNRRK